MGEDEGGGEDHDVGGDGDADDADDDDDGVEEEEKWGDGLLWDTAAVGEDRLVVRWEPSLAQRQRDNKKGEGEKQGGQACGMWLLAHATEERQHPRRGAAKVGRLVLEPTLPHSCGAAFRTAAQRAFDGAFGHFFRMDYAAFRLAFAPNATFVWHADPVSPPTHSPTRVGPSSDPFSLQRWAHHGPRAALGEDLSWARARAERLPTHASADLSSDVYVDQDESTVSERSSWVEGDACTSNAIPLHCCIHTAVEFEPITGDDQSAAYYVVRTPLFRMRREAMNIDHTHTHVQIFRPLTLRSTGELLGEVRGLLVVRINEAGLIDYYQMTILDHRVHAILARSLTE